MRQAIELEIVRAIGEVVPVADLRWRAKAARVAAERIETMVAADRVIRAESVRIEVEAEDRFSIPENVAEAWAARLAEVYENVEAAINGAIGVDDDRLGDLIETLDLVSRHCRTTFDDVRTHGSRIPAAFEASTFN